MNLSLHDFEDVDNVDRLLVVLSAVVEVVVYCICFHLLLGKRHASGELLNKCCFHGFDSESLQSVVAAVDLTCFVLS